jgi:hypothetical protein
MRKIPGFLSDIGLGYLLQGEPKRIKETLKRAIFPALDRVRGLPTRLMTLATWFLYLPLEADFFPLFPFFAQFFSVPTFLGCKGLCCRGVAFWKTPFKSKGLADFGRTMVRYRSHNRTVSGRTMVRYYRPFITKVFHTCTNV